MCVCVRVCVRGGYLGYFSFEANFAGWVFQPWADNLLEIHFFHPFPPPLPSTGIFPQRSQPKAGRAGAAHHFPVLGSDGERTDRQKGGTEQMQTPLLESKAKRKGGVKERNNSYKRNLLGSYRPCSSQSPSEIAF